MRKLVLSELETLSENSATRTESDFGKILVSLCVYVYYICDET